MKRCCVGRYVAKTMLHFAQKMRTQHQQILSILLTKGWILRVKQGNAQHETAMFWGLEVMLAVKGFGMR